MSKDEIMLKEIDLLQDCIKRMASNSFQIKGWCIVAVVAILGLFSSNKSITLNCIIAWLIVLSLYSVDCYFLYLEKLYVSKYNWVIKNRMQTSKYQFDLNPKNKKTMSEKVCFCETMFSPSLLTFYMALIILIAIVFLNSKYNWL